MRFTIPFLLAVAVFTGTVLGANQTSFNPNEDLLFDIVSASDAIAFRLERGLGISENMALIIGGLLLTIPALLAFHLFRIGFGGTVQAIVQERETALARAEEHRRLPNSVIRQREAEAKNRARAAAERQQEAENKEKAQTGEVLAGVKAGETARPVSGEALDARASARPEQTEGGTGSLGSNIAAALKGRRDASTSSGTTSLSSNAGEEGSGIGRGLRDSWDSLLDKRPNLANLRDTAADGIRKSLKRTGKAASGVTGLGKGTSGQS